MNLHVVAPIEFPAALGTRVGLLAVNVTMSRQVARLGEARAALLANVLPQTLVLEQMLVQERLRRVTIVANVANEGFRIRVLKYVSLVLGGDLERLRARLARVSRRVAGLHVIVQNRETRVQIVAETTAKVSSIFQVYTADVREQPCTEREDLAAVLAGEILRWKMRLDVHLQRDLVMVRLRAVGASVGFDALVNVVVLGEVELRPEPLRALGALHRSWIRVRAPYVLHHVRLADELRAAERARVLLYAEMGLHVYRALVASLVDLSTELARVTGLPVDGDLLDVVVDADLLAVDSVELLRILTRAQPLLHLLELVDLRYAVRGVLPAALAAAAVRYRADDLVDLGVALVLEERNDSRTDETGALVGKDLRQDGDELGVALLATELEGETNVLGVAVTIRRLLHGDLHVRRRGDDGQDFVEGGRWDLDHARVFWGFFRTRGKLRDGRRWIILVVFFLRGIRLAAQSTRDRGIAAGSRLEDPIARRYGR